MSWKDDLCDAWMENMPEDYDILSREKQLEAYMKFEREYIENGYAKADYLNDQSQDR